MATKSYSIQNQCEFLNNGTQRMASCFVLCLFHGNSTISTSIQLEDCLIHLIATHPFRPGLLHGNRILTKELKAISELVGINSDQTIVIGDLNTTMWSTTYIDFVNTCNLSNLRQGRGVLPSWSRIIPWRRLSTSAEKPCKRTKCRLQLGEESWLDIKESSSSGN